MGMNAWWIEIEKVEKNEQSMFSSVLLNDFFCFKEEKLQKLCNCIFIKKIFSILVSTTLYYFSKLLINALRMRQIQILT